MTELLMTEVLEHSLVNSTKLFGNVLAAVQVAE